MNNIQQSLKNYNKLRNKFSLFSIPLIQRSVNIEFFRI